ncbi:MULTISPECIES: cold-shock protein [unclassified Siphonobacter]|uniref:cold-shock protein n=1 Tax=unclassified Siphonobacter TaxID=2635712 RepID=UPI00278A660B|nr:MULTISPECIES: cold shock domain-containing protein [unclassified Siphonobacter]MDQ1085853.1 CspA family cold shock protein [Siphonobacter sp. SORGH_AS_1065]MDR6196124.1 CspA family cold shock protein [Siphonobacter sp. SORGH_AS_0500]
MNTGTVKFYNESKGFGFIVDDATGQDIFVHVTGLNGLQISQDDRVSYETISGKKGVNAVNVQKLA